jgi:glyoxylate reductase
MSSSWFSARIARFPQPIAQERRYGTFGSLTAQRAIPVAGRAARTLRPMARVLVTRRVSEGGLDPLVAAGHEIVPPHPDDVPLLPEELAAAASQVDGIVCQLTDRIDGTVLRAGLPRLRVVADVAVGYDNIDVATAGELGISVCNTPGVLDETTADLAFLLILAAARRSSDAEASLRGGRWLGFQSGAYLGRDVHGRTLGVVGFGRIGQAVARRAAGFGMEVVHHTRRDTGIAGWIADLDDLLRTADIVTLHVPLNLETTRLIDARRLRLMKRDAVLVNTARGPVVDEEALAIALEDGTIFGAGIDVYEREPVVHPRLLAAPHTVLLPHIGSASEATRRRMAQLACEGVVAVLAGERPPNLVTP